MQTSLRERDGKEQDGVSVKWGGGYTNTGRTQGGRPWRPPHGAGGNGGLCAHGESGGRKSQWTGGRMNPGDEDNSTTLPG